MASAMAAPEIRPLDLAGVGVMLEMAAAEGWNPGLADAAPFLAADPGGFLGLFEAGEDRPSAVISLVRMGAEASFLGLYICRPDRRGLGLGRRLWAAAIARAGGRSIGLDGVIAQQPTYRRHGFVDAWRSIRFAGPARADGDPGDARPATAADLADLIAYDRRPFGHPRPAFLARWLTAPGHVTVVRRNARGTLLGYGLRRPCATGHKIGPLFAADAASAAMILAGLTGPVAGETVVLDVPEPNSAAMRLGETEGLRPVFEVARMYRGPADALPLQEIFGFTTFELG